VNELTVTLNPREMLLGASVGILRHIQSLSRGDRKVSGLFWNGAPWVSGMTSYAGDDVGEWSVRTRSSHNFDLIFRPGSDREDRKYVLVTGRDGRYKVWGWIWGRDCKVLDWYKDPTRNGRPKAYFVPKAALTPYRTDSSADPQEAPDRRP
jgi:hypothetical protein